MSVLDRNRVSQHLWIPGHQFSRKRCIRGCKSAQGRQDTEQSLQGHNIVLYPVCTLLSSPVPSDIPVGQDIHELDQAKHNSIEPVSCHFGVKKPSKYLCEGQDPLVCDVGTFLSHVLVVDEFHFFLILQLQDVLDEEAVGVVPREQHILQDITHTLLLKSKVFCSHHRGVDQIQSG